MSTRIKPTFLGFSQLPVIYKPSKQLEKKKTSLNAYLKSQRVFDWWQRLEIVMTRMAMVPMKPMISRMAVVIMIVAVVVIAVSAILAQIVVGVAIRLK